VLEERVLRQFQNGANNGTGPEVDAEELIRANMVVRANTMTYLAASPQLLQGLVDLLNHRVTPVARTLGGTGEADGPIVGNVNGVLVGRGEAYVDGQRMKAADALAKVGLKPIAPAPGDGTVSTTNADFAGQAALLVADAHQLLDWADLVYTMDLEAMNSSVTPLFRNVQDNRPYPWLNWQAARALEMIKGSYLFNDDPTRIIQDPESLRASAIRQGATWLAWSRLKDTVTTAINYSDHNPAVSIDYGPTTAWELATPQAMKYYVKGGPESHGKHGYVFSNANWDPYPIGNRIESFTIALANLDVMVMLRQEKYQYTFFTVVTANEILNPQSGQGGPGRGGGGGGFGLGWVNHEVWQTIQGLINPVPPEGYSSDPEQVEELDAETLFKVKRAAHALNESWMLVASDVNTGARWMDVRKAQDGTRAFGPGPTAALEAYRKVVPLKPEPGSPPVGPAVLNFLKTTPATNFLPAVAMPDEAPAKKK
jgi:histidine ammonia-lyase